MTAEREDLGNVISIKKASNLINVVPSLAISIKEAKESIDLLITVMMFGGIFFLVK